MKDNKKGSALLWAIIVVMILEVVIAASLGIAYAYYNRSIQNNNQRQAYLTSKGVIENIVERIKSGDTDYISLFKDLKEEESTNLTIRYDDTAKVGNTVGSIQMHTHDEDVRGYLTITITTYYASQEDTIKADMQLGMNGGIERWQLLRYYKGDSLPLTKNTNTQAA